MRLWYVFVHLFMWTLHAKLMPLKFIAIRRCLKIPKSMKGNRAKGTKRNLQCENERQAKIKSKKERTNGRRKMNRFYKAKCVCELWAPNAFSWFSSELWWVVGISPKMMPFKGAQNTRKCYLSMLFTNIHTLYASYHTVSIVPSSDQFSHTPGLYGNTKQMQCVAECLWNVFSSEMCEFVHASTGDSCAANTKCVYVLIFISMNHRRRRMKISSISWKTTPQHVRVWINAKLIVLFTLISKVFNNFLYYMWLQFTNPKNEEEKKTWMKKCGSLDSAELKAF